MSQRIYVDEILQSFVNDGNVFLKLGAVSGDVDATGQDIREAACTLIIPLQRFGEFCKNIAVAQSLYLTSESQERESIPLPSPQVELGQPLLIP